jgi:hypothetical protein
VREKLVIWGCKTKMDGKSLCRSTFVVVYIILHTTH